MIFTEAYYGPHKLVLAFDIGTTYSGISYCILQPGYIPEMHGVTRFLGQEGPANAKVPSTLYYDENGHVQAAGVETLADEMIQQAEDKEWVKVEWWKLYLRPEHLSFPHIQDNDLPPLPPGKSAIDVLTDFIKYLFNCAKAYIQERHSAFDWSSTENAIEFVFTYPNDWEGQQQQYRDAVERAGLAPATPEGRSRVHMMTEGEASLHYCVASLPERPANTGPQEFVVIDAGGGTINVTTYSVIFDPVSCEEAAPAECFLEGAMFVTQRARKLLKKKLDGSRYCNDEEMSAIMRDFDQTTKLRISDEAKDIYIKIGSPGHHDKQYEISHGKLKLSGVEATGLFDKSIRAIIDAFARQHKSVKPKIAMAFLVREFRANEFVWTRLRLHFEAQGVKITRPENDIDKLVASGAVISYINRAIEVRAARAGSNCRRRIDEHSPERQHRRDQRDKVQFPNPSLMDISHLLTTSEKAFTEMIELDELQGPLENSTLYFIRAIVRSRMGMGGDALHDAEMAIKTKRSMEGYIAKSVVLCHRGDYEGAMQAFDLTFRHAAAEDVSFLLLLKAILVFLAGLCNPAISRVEELIKLEPDEPLHRLILAQMFILLAVAAADDGDYGRTLDLLTRAGDPGPLHEDSRWKDLSMITGWKLNRVRITVYRQKCETLLATGGAKDAADHFHLMMNALQRDIGYIHETHETEWVVDFKSRCLKALVQRGDASMDSASYEDAIVHYTTALTLDPLSTNLLTKRSKARMAIGSWNDSLEDANAAIKLDPLSPHGYERKHAALLGAQRYDEAIDAYKNMLLNLEQSPDPVIRESRKNYVSPSQTMTAICHAVKLTQWDAPLVLVNTETGRLCDKQKCMDEFKADPKFKELVASMTTSLDKYRIIHAVQEYFRYATFSHTWEGAEPLFHDVLHRSVNELATSPTILKLVMFCATVREAGFHWAWSDTCCINKADGSVLQESLTSMFRWYHESSLTIIHLKGVLSDSELGALERSLWNTRAWTLQEFFASRVVRFYTEDWKPYLPHENVYNHKDSSVIMDEMARATGVDAHVLLSLRPGPKNVRQKLRLAATRVATKQEDLAYSLFGIFDVSIPATYGEGQQRALGRLLQEVLTQSGDITILAWTGKASNYNSCLPAEISVYREPESPHVPFPIEEGKMDVLVWELRTSSAHLDSAMVLYDQVVVLPSPRLGSRRLSLSCIMFPLKGTLVPSGGTGQHVYHAVTSAFGTVEIRTTEDLSDLKHLVLVHPWLKCLLDPALPFEDPIVDDGGGPLSPSPFHTPYSLHHSSQPDKLTSALRLFARLKQPFGALLLVPLSHNEYRRVASDHPIVVQLLKEVSPHYLTQNIRTVDIL